MVHTPTTAHPRRWWILGALCLSLLVLVIDNSILNLAIPALMDELDATPADIQWIISGYTLAFAGLLLTAGGLSDRYGRRRTLIVGLMLFGGASLGATFATDPGQLIVGRALMGVGGALVMPSTMSILITVFDETERRRAIAVWSSVSVAGVLVGPSLGGFLLDHFWWGSIFLVNVPVAAVAILAAVLMMPESRGPASPPDVPGAIMCTLGMVAIVWSIIAVPEYGWDSPATTGTLVAGGGILLAFVGWEVRTRHPMLPLRVFRDRDFSGGTFSVMLLSFAAGGMMLALSQYVQLVLGYGVFRAGMALLPFPVAAALFNTLGATVGRRFGNRTMVTTGMLVTAAGFGVLGLVGPNSGYPLLAGALATMGIGAGLATPAAVTVLMSAIPPEHAGAGSAMNSTLSQAGNSIGVAVLGSVLAAGYLARLPEHVPGDSLADAVATGRGEVVADAQAAFSSAMSSTMVAGVVLALAAAATAFGLIRRTRSSVTPTVVSSDRSEPSPAEVTGIAAPGRGESDRPGR